MSFSDVNFNFDAVRDIAGSYAEVMGEYKEQVGSFIGRIFKPIQENPVLAVTAIVVGAVALVGVYAFGKYVKNLKEENTRLNNSNNLKDQIITGFNKTINSKAEESMRLNQTINLKDQEITGLNKTINSKDQEIATGDAFFKEVNRASLKLQKQNNVYQKREKSFTTEIADLKKENEEIKVINKKVEEAHKPLSEEHGALKLEHRKLQEEKVKLSAKLSIFDEYIRFNEEETDFSLFEAKHKKVEIEDINKEANVSSGGGFLSALFSNAFAM